MQAIAVSSRQRRFSNRSRAGCVDCKRRRVKCDELKPRCTQCARLGLICTYEASKTAASEVHATEHQQKEMPARSTGSEQLSLAVISTSFTVAQYGAPADWTQIEIEGMYDAVQFNTALTYRDGHLLAAGKYMHPYFVQHSFHSAAARCAFLGMRYREKAQQQQSLASSQLAIRFRVIAIGLLREALQNSVDANNVEMLLSCATCLFISGSDDQERTRLIEGADALYKAVFTLTGRPPFGLPDSRGFIIDPMYLSLDHDFGLIRTLAAAFQRFARAATRYDELRRAMQNLTAYHINMPHLLHRSRTSVADCVAAAGPLQLSAHLPPSAYLRLGAAKPPLLILIAFYSITILVADVLRPDFAEGGEAQSVENALCIGRIHARLIEDGETSWLPYVQVPHTFAEMFIATGTVRTQELALETTS